MLVFVDGPNIIEELVFVSGQQKRWIFLDQGSCNHGFAHPSRSWNYIVGLPSQILQKFSVKFCLTLLPPLFLPCIPLLLSVESPKLRLLFGYNFCIEYVSQGVQNYSRRAIGSESLEADYKAIIINVNS